MWDGPSTSTSIPPVNGLVLIGPDYAAKRSADQRSIVLVWVILCRAPVGEDPLWRHGKKPRISPASTGRSRTAIDAFAADNSCRHCRRPIRDRPASPRRGRAGSGSSRRSTARPGTDSRAPGRPRCTSQAGERVALVTCRNSQLYSMLSMPCAVRTTLPASMTVCSESFFACAHSSSDVQVDALDEIVGGLSRRWQQHKAPMPPNKPRIRISNPSMPTRSSDRKRLAYLRNDHLGRRTLHAFDEFVGRLVDDREAWRSGKVSPTRT